MKTMTSAMVSTLKNTIMKYAEESEKSFGRQELSKVGIEAIQLSPPIGSKVKKIMQAVYSYEYNEGVPEKMGLSIDNPALDVVGNLVEASTNIPLARTVRKAQQIQEAVSGNHDAWKRAALVMGWSKWDIGVEDEDIKKARAEVKQEKAEKKKAEKAAKKKEKEEAKQEDKKEKEEKRVRCIAQTPRGRCKNRTRNVNKKCYAHR